MIRFGWLVTFYICFSFILFLATSFTIAGWIIYGVFLLPFYGIVLLVWWRFVGQNRTQLVRIK